MAKKKLSLKPVNRGFATTSVQSKKQKEEAAEAEAKAKAEKLEEEIKPTAESVGSHGAPVNGQAPAVDGASSGVAVKEDWEDERAEDEARLQGLVDRLQDKGDKEAARIVKGIEYDNRIAKGYAPLSIEPVLRDQVLALAIEDEGPVEAQVTTGPEGGSSRAIKGLSSSTSDRDKVLLRLYIAYAVLTRLGFSQARVTECLLGGLEADGGWEEALEWMWLHLTEDECTQQGEFAPQQERLDFDEPLGPPAPVEPEDISPRPEPIPADQTDPGSSDDVDGAAPPVTSEPSSMFQSLDASDDSSSDSEEEDPESASREINTRWARLCLELDNLRIAGGAASKTRSKKKGPAVVLETPEMRAVMEQIKKVEKEYMFAPKNGAVILRTLKAQRDAAAIEAKLRQRGVERVAKMPIRPAEEAAEADASSSDEDEGGLFGAMLDEPDNTSVPATSTSIRVRSMPIPKQSAYSGTTPKALLRSLVMKAFKSAVLQFVPLSGGSRAARAGLQILFNDKYRRVWRMDDIACEDMQQAENYMSLVALHELSAKGEIGQVTWRGFPPEYRTLWEEQEDEWKAKEDAKRREVWAKLSEVYESKVAAVPLRDEKDSAMKVPATDSSLAPGRAPLPFDGARLQAEYERRVASPAYMRMRQQRDGLPIASFRQKILDTIASSQVMVLSGETGCGKSTQLPAYILEDQLRQGKPCKIYVTEPRRISAISLAQRVSAELGDAPGQMGTPASLVGYSIRLEAKTSPQTRLAFVTNGIALRMLEAGSVPGRGTAFDEVTHIVVDEVHERSIDSDFLLIVLRALMQPRPELKIILMSATLDAEKISGYFGGCPYLAVPGRTFPVQVNYLEDAVQAAEWHIDESSPYAVRTRHRRAGTQLEWTEDTPANSDSEDEGDTNPTKLSAARFSAKTVSTVNLLDSRQIPYELIVRLLERICFEDEQYRRFSAATLVFMPGLAEIRKLNDALLGHPAFGSQEFVVYPLHSTISSEGQQAVFDIPPPGVRKIVISTNIAETGVTIPDITCVIDSGKHREMRYDEKRQISRLVETYVAQSNAKQRRGRAGRVQEGLAFHLFTKARHDNQLAEHPIPEMLRLSLQDLALRIKILRLNLGTSVEAVLLQALDPPTSLNIQRAIASLVEVKALTLGEEITPMGRLLSKLPMDVHLGKFLLVAAMMKCLDPALTIAATLNGKSPFVTPFGMEGAADTAKRGFAAGNSDFLTIVNAFNAWRRASDNPNYVRVFCRKNFLSHQNLQQTEELRQQLLAYLVDSGFVSATNEQKREINQARYGRGFRTRFVTVPAEMNVNAENVHILGAALVAGLYPKVLSLEPSGGLKTIINQQPVSIHPSSVNFRRKAADFGTNYLTYFTIMQSKKLYAWEVSPVDDKALLMLCGDQVDFKPAAGSFSLDRKIRYSISPKMGIAIKILRGNFALAMNARLRGKRLSEKQENWFELGVRCLSLVQVDEPEQLGIVQT